MFKPRRLRRVLLAGVGLACLLASPAAAGDELSVSRSSGLKDGDEIEVKLTGWDGGVPQVDLVQCTPNARSIGDCAVAETQATVIMDFGVGEATIAVRTLDTYVHCDKKHDCALVAFTNPSDFGDHATFVNLSFNDDARGGGAIPGGDRDDKGPNKLLWALIVPVLAAGVLALRRGSQRQQDQEQLHAR